MWSDWFGPVVRLVPGCGQPGSDLWSRLCSSVRPALAQDLQPEESLCCQGHGVPAGPSSRGSQGPGALCWEPASQPVIQAEPPPGWIFWLPALSLAAEQTGEDLSEISSTWSPSHQLSPEQQQGGPPGRASQQGGPPADAGTASQPRGWTARTGISVRRLD